MSLFRRPTDDDSESDSESEESEDTDLHDQSRESTEEFIRTDLTRTETISSGESISVGNEDDDTSIANVEHHRNMMLASLLEDFYKTRAAELLNTATPGASYHRRSPEIQTLANTLFTQASQTLAAGGVLPASTTSAGAQINRNQYLTGFDNLGLQNIQDVAAMADFNNRRLSAASGQTQALVKANRRPELMTSNFFEQKMHEIAVRKGSNGFMSGPTNDMRLSNTHSPRSHYQSSFQEMRLLGKGGFGRVYHTYNFFDKTDYAIKKIPLSPKLSQKYRESGHAELTSVLREVQALAQLDHCNVVRYHATWIEEPSATTNVVAPVPPRFSRPQYIPKMLANKPAFPSNQSPPPKTHTKLKTLDVSNEIMFAADSFDVGAGQSVGPGWSVGTQNHQIEPSSAADTDIFTDGFARNLSQAHVIDDPYCYVLHVQMSLYPQTLAQYIAPARTDAPDRSITPLRRHCFHLLPALRILLGILCGLQYIHAKGLLHRDIKPGNIFISHQENILSYTLPEGYQDVGMCKACPTQSPHHINPRIGDFGLVAELAHDTGEIRKHSSSSSDKAVGTEYYRPSTTSKGKNKVSSATNEKLDVFAVGVILVELLYRCDTSMERLEMLKGIQHGKLPSGLVSLIDREKHGNDIGHRVVECIHGMIQQNADERWSCSDVKDYVEAILKDC